MTLHDIIISNYQIIIIIILMIIGLCIQCILLGNLIGYNKAIKDFKEIYFGAKKENDTD